MKNLLSIFLLSFIFCACDPDNKDIFNLEVVKIGATLSTTNPTINLGDTLKIKVEMPTAVNGSSGSINVNSLQKAQFYMYINKIDTITNRAILLQQPLYWTSKGAISPTNAVNFEYTTNSSPYGVDINFKPQEKGIYYLEVLSQAGQIKLNNVYDARLIVNFNVPDQHLHLATPFFGSAWTNNAQTREPGTYVFRVN